MVRQTTSETINDKGRTFMLDLVAFGEILWDVIDGEAHIGGAPFNLRRTRRAAGWKAAAVSRVGDDALGRAALEEMARLPRGRPMDLVRPGSSREP
jgi:hypothetical protein